MIDPRAAPDAITVPYRIDRAAIIAGLRLANRRGPVRLRAPAANLMLAMVIAGVCLAWSVLSASMTAAWFHGDTKVRAFYVSDAFLYTLIGVYGGTLWLFLWGFMAFLTRGAFPEQADRLIDVFGALPRDGRLTLSRQGIAAETSVGLRIWAPPLLLAAYETPETFVFVSKLQEILALPKRGLSAGEIAAVAERVRSGVLGRTD